MNKMLSLRLLENTDMPLIEAWMNKEHIKKWYDIPPVCTTEDWLAEIKGRNDAFSFITHYLAMLDDIPVGFCQYYACKETDEDWYGNIPLPGTYSIDYLIGEETYLRKGIGKAMIALLVTEIFRLPECERIIVQPDEENNASCQSLISNGFVLDLGNNVYIKTK